jgi:hypothetical protein
MTSHYEFDGTFPRPHGCPHCGGFGFPDGYDHDGSDLWCCEICGESYVVEDDREDEYHDEEDRYADWERYYGDA